MQHTVFIRELCKIIFVGMGGVALLYGFFALFLAAPAQLVLFPFVVGFNGTVSGYNLAEKTGVFACCWKSYCIAASLFWMTGLLSLAVTAPQLLAGEWRNEVLFFTAVSFVAAFGGLCFGRWVAAKAQRNSREKSAVSCEETLQDNHC